MGAAAVRLKEVDLSTRVASFEGVFGAIVIPAKKGRTDKPFFVSSDTQFLNATTPDGRVNVGYDTSYFSALSYLERSNKLWVQRAINNAYYGGLLIKSMATATAASFSGLIPGIAGNVSFTADTPGVAGNSIAITFGGSLNLNATVGAYNVANPTATITIGDNGDLGGGGIGTAGVINLTGGISPGANAPIPSGSDIADPSAFALAANDAILIYGSSEGAFANDIGIKLTTVADRPSLIEPDSFLIEVFKRSNQVVPVESFLVSRVLGQKDGYGLNMFVEDVLDSSEYIRAISNPVVVESVAPSSQSSVLFLEDGDDGLAVNDSIMVAAANKFANKSETNVTILMDGGYATPAYGVALNTIAQNRQDCVAILSVPYSDENASTYMTDIVAYRKDELNINSSYSALYSTHLQIQDRFNDRKIWVAPDGFIAGSISFSASNFEIWFPPAGFKRGVLNVLDARRRFTDGEMDVLADAGINPIRFASGKGIVVWGQKTLLDRASALDRLNVRLLLIVIEPAIKELLESVLFDLNDTSIGGILEVKISSYLNRIKARKGIEDFDVVSDESNNTDADRDANILNVDIFIKPSKSIEEIPVRVVITPSNISFSDAAGSI